MTTDDFKTFLEKQDTLYKDFHAAQKELTETGLEPKVKPVGGYLIFYRHNDDINRRVEEVSEAIAFAVPSILYTENIVHTTISDYDVRKGFEPDDQVLNKLAWTARMTQSHPVPDFDFAEALANRDSAIIKGYADEFFHMAARHLADEAKKKGLELRMPWGSHITASRFVSGGTRQGIENLVQVVEEVPSMGTSRPVSLNVGYFQLSERGFDLTTYESFPLGTG